MKISKGRQSRRYYRWDFKFTTNFTGKTVEAGEAWVYEHVPGVKAMATGFESIDVVLNYDKGVAIVELAEN